MKLKQNQSGGQLDTQTSGNKIGPFGFNKKCLKLSLSVEL